MKKKKEEEKKEESPLPKAKAHLKDGDITKSADECKKHLVTSFPDIKKVPITDKIDFIIVPCDGIWDCFTNEQAVKFVRNKRAKGPKGGA